MRSVFFRTLNTEIFQLSAFRQKLPRNSVLHSRQTMHQNATEAQKDETRSMLTNDRIKPDRTYEDCWRDAIDSSVHAASKFAKSALVNNKINITKK